jgi:hypothetical protein
LLNGEEETSMSVKMMVEWFFRICLHAITKERVGETTGV